MRRSPIIITATAFGTAAVLGFHARSPAVPAATTAATSTAATGPSTPATAPQAASTTSTNASSDTTSATGGAMNTRYGPAQVKITVSGGKITKIEAVELQTADRKSQQISDYAAPILQQSALAKQTAAVDTVSGATYTSLSYEASLQSALDKLGFKTADASTASTDVSQLQ